MLVSSPVVINYTQITLCSPLTANYLFCTLHLCTILSSDKKFDFHSCVMSRIYVKIEQDGFQRNYSKLCSDIL